MWRCAQQDLALGERFRDQAKFVVLEVAQATVNQFGAPRRSVRCEVVSFREQHLQPTPRGIARDAGAIDAAADNGQIVDCVGGRAHIVVFVGRLF